MSDVNDLSLMTVEQTAEFLQVSKDIVYRMCGNQEIPAVKISGLWRINKRRLVEQLEAQFEAKS